MRVFVAASLAAVVSGELPRWLKRELRESIQTGIERFGSISSMDLEDFEQVDGSDIFSHFATGGDEDSVLEYFTPSLGELSPLMAGLTGFKPESMEVPFFCLFDLLRVWMDRPTWFYPTKSEFSKARTCFPFFVELLETSLSQKSDFSKSYALSLARFSDVLFSGSNEAALRSPTIDRADLDSVGGFVSFIRGRHWLMELVTRAASSAPAVRDPATKRGMLYITRLITEFPDRREDGLMHASDFLNHLGHEATSLKLWKLVLEIPDADAVIMRMTRDSPFIIDDLVEAQSLRLTHYKNGMGAGRQAWMDSVGLFLVRLWTSNKTEGQSAIRKCVMELDSVESASELLSHLEESEETIVPTYRCLIEQIVDTRAIEVPATDVAVLMHMIKLSFDAMTILSEH